MDVSSLGKLVVNENDGRREEEGLFLSQIGYSWAQGKDF